MGLSFGDSLLKFTEGVATGVSKTLEKEEERNLKLAELNSKKRDELLKTRWSSMNKRREKDVELITAITSAGGIDTMKSQALAKGYKDTKTMFEDRDRAGDSWEWAKMPVVGDEPVLSYSDADAMYQHMGANNENAVDRLAQALGADKREKAVMPDKALGNLSTYRRKKAEDLTEEQSTKMNAWKSTSSDPTTKFKEAMEYSTSIKANLKLHPEVREYLITNRVASKDWESTIDGIVMEANFGKTATGGNIYDNILQVIGTGYSTPSGATTTTATTPIISAAPTGSQLEQLEAEVSKQLDLTHSPIANTANAANKKGYPAAQKALLKFKEVLAKNAVEISNKFKAIGLEKAINRDQGSWMYATTIAAGSVVGDGDYFYDTIGTKGKKKKQLNALGKNYADALEMGINGVANTLALEARADEVLDVKKLDAIDWTNISTIAKQDLAGRTFEFDAGSWSTANSAYVIPYNVVPFGTEITDDIRVRYESGLLKFVKDNEANVARDATLGDISAKYYTLQTQGTNLLTPMSDTTENIVTPAVSAGDLQLMSDGTTPTISPVDIDVQFTVVDGIKGILGNKSDGSTKFLPFTIKNKARYESLGLGYLFEEGLGDVPRMYGDPRDNEWADPVVEPTMVEDVSEWLGDAADEVMRALPGIPGGNAAKMPSIISTYYKTGQVPAQLGIAAEKFGLLLDKLGITRHPMAQQIVKGKFGGQYGSRKAQIADKFKDSTTGKVVNAVTGRIKKNVSSSTNRLKQRAATKARAVKTKVKNTGGNILDKTTGTNKPGYPINNPTKSRIDQYNTKTSNIK